MPRARRIAKAPVATLARGTLLWRKPPLFKYWLWRPGEGRALRASRIFYMRGVMVGSSS
ncbi:MAG: hypothetical protein RRE21_02790 [Desulfurococcales archaeon]|nr:hypothetical protein [Desulfurococcales archaeon]